MSQNLKLKEYGNVGGYVIVIKGRCSETPLETMNYSLRMKYFGHMQVNTITLNLHCTKNEVFH